jgi:hypothetical protein
MPVSRPCLLLAALLSATSAVAQSLPQTGQLDNDKVLQARYGDSTAAAAPAQATAAPASAVQAVATQATPNQATPSQAMPAWRDAITGVIVDTGAASGAAAMPVTFGQVFAPGDLKRGETLTGRLADGRTVPLQVDVKATHADGSVRHAVLSALLPGGGKPGSQSLALVKDKSKAAAASPSTPPSPRALLDAGFTAAASASINGQAWTASADQLLRQKPAVWLNGPVATEWLVSAPLRNEKGAEHPRLSARFAVRWYPALGKARVDIAIENAWAFQQAPRNEIYDARIVIKGKEVYAKHGLTHYNQARWRKTFWTSEVPAVHVRHDTAYLIASRALPNYDRSVRVSAKALADLGAGWQGPKTEPMGAGLAMPYMPTTGGRDDIGLLPGWAVLYLLSMDTRAKTATLGTADLAGSWSVHYRDRGTGRPVSLIDYPYISRVGGAGDATNPRTGKSELLPPCAKGACDNPNVEDIAHQPGFAYLPYLVTGDAYYLEELEFWAMFNAFRSNPAYRENAKGLLKPEQMRGQAWGLRTLGQAAYIVPDADPLKSHFRRILASNLDWYNATYTNNMGATRLGFVSNGYAMSYKNGTGLAPWQDDFFTATVGHLADLGFPEAARLLAWKVAFPIARMTAPGACWIDAAMYEMVVREPGNGPFYPTMAQIFKVNRPATVANLACASGEMAQALKLKQGEMTGYADSPQGMPAVMQPALAYAADAGGEAGRAAWALFSRRSIKPDYGGSPQFAIVPRRPQK